MEKEERNYRNVLKEMIIVMMMMMTTNKMMMMMTNKMMAGKTRNEQNSNPLERPTENANHTLHD